MAKRRRLIEFDKFVMFVREQLSTGDYDAHVPFLTELSNRLELVQCQRLWMCVLYMAYYTEGSMWAAWCAPGVKGSRAKPPLGLPITTQRRNLYGGRIAKHFQSWSDIESLVEYFDVNDWQQLLDRVRAIYGNGRWASYTTAELLTVVGELGVEPNTFDIFDSTGPRAGMAALGLEPNETSARYLSDRLHDLGLQLADSQLESILCDWAGMSKGTFYPGRNIDRQQARILKVERLLNRKFSTLWQVRNHVYPHRCLGELNGWEGIDKLRLKRYAKTRGVVVR